MNAEAGFPGHDNHLPRRYQAVQSSSVTQSGGGGDDAGADAVARGSLVREGVSP